MKTCTVTISGNGRLRTCDGGSHAWLEGSPRQSQLPLVGEIRSFDPFQYIDDNTKRSHNAGTKGHTR